MLAEDTIYTHVKSIVHVCTYYYHSDKNVTKYIYFPTLLINSDTYMLVEDTIYTH